jgi:hypothetical protein
VTRPPKLRYPPGTFVRFPNSAPCSEDSGVWEVMYAYRLADAPHEWRYLLRRNNQFERSSQGKVFYEPVRDSGQLKLDPWTYTKCMTNRQMLAEAEYAIDDLFLS